MRVELRLRALLRRYGIPEHGAQKSLAKYLKVERPVAGRLFNNRNKQLSLDNLGGLCHWLVEQVEGQTLQNALRNELPGCLFGLDGLWECMFRSSVITAYLGEKVLTSVREDGQILAPARAWISSMDVTATLTITQRLAGEGSTASHRTELIPFHLEEGSKKGAKRVPGKRLEDDRRRAACFFVAARKTVGETALIVGSQKVNILTEVFIAAAYKAQAFREAPKKALPFYVSYRNTDSLEPKSCFGGHGTPKGLSEAPRPGIYYKESRRKWALAPWVPEQSSAGLILVNYDDERDSLDVVLFGFCAQGTRLLAQKFCDNPDQFWPKESKNRNRFGVFVCPIRFEEGEHPEHPKLTGFEVIALPG